MPDQEVREINPVRRRNNLHQVVFDLFRSGLPGEVEAPAQALDVGIHDNAFGFPVRDTEDDVGGFAAAAGQLDEFGQGGRDLAGMPLGQGPATVADGLGFVAEETGGLDQFFQLARRRGGKVGGGPVSGEEGRGDLVDTFVSALGAEDGGDEELQRGGVVKFAAHVGIGDPQGGDDFFDAER